MRTMGVLFMKGWIFGPSVKMWALRFFLMMIDYRNLSATTGCSQIAHFVLCWEGGAMEDWTRLSRTGPRTGGNLDDELIDGGSGGGGREWGGDRPHGESQERKVVDLEAEDGGEAAGAPQQVGGFALCGGFPDGMRRLSSALLTRKSSPRFRRRCSSLCE